MTAESNKLATIEADPGNAWVNLERQRVLLLISKLAEIDWELCQSGLWREVDGKRRNKVVMQIADFAGAIAWRPSRWWQNAQEGLSPQPPHFSLPCGRFSRRAVFYNEAIAGQVDLLWNIARNRIAIAWVKANPPLKPESDLPLREQAARARRKTQKPNYFLYNAFENRAKYIELLEAMIVLFEKSADDIGLDSSQTPVACRYRLENLVLDVTEAAQLRWDRLDRFELRLSPQEMLAGARVASIVPVCPQLPHADRMFGDWAEIMRISERQANILLQFHREVEASLRPLTMQEQQEILARYAHAD